MPLDKPSSAILTPPINVFSNQRMLIPKLVLQVEVHHSQVWP